MSKDFSCNRKYLSFFKFQYHSRLDADRKSYPKNVANLLSLCKNMHSEGQKPINNKYQPAPFKLAEECLNTRAYHSPGRQSSALRIPSCFPLFFKPTVERSTPTAHSVRVCIKDSLSSLSGEGGGPYRTS